MTHAKQVESAAWTLVFAAFVAALAAFLADPLGDTVSLAVGAVALAPGLWLGRWFAVEQTGDAPAGKTTARFAGAVALTAAGGFPVERLTTRGTTTGEVASVLTLAVCAQVGFRLGARAYDECRDAIRRIAQA